MTPEQAKKKTALIILGSILASLAVLALIILLRDFILVTIFFLSVIACVAMTVWGIWDEYWQQMYAREKMIDDLYARCNSEKQRWFTKFYIEYFKL